MFKKKSDEQKFAEKAHDDGMSMQREINAMRNVEAADAGVLGYQDGKADLVKWQQDLTEDLIALQHDLLREYYVNGEWKKETEMVLFRDDDGSIKQQQVLATPLVNEHGMYRILTLVRRYLNRNCMMSNLDETIIYRQMRDLVNRLVLNLGTNCEAYGIQKTDLPLIVKIVKDYVEHTLWRAYHHGEVNYLTTVNKRVEAHTLHEEQAKKGWFG